MTTIVRGDGPGSIEEIASSQNIIRVYRRWRISTVSASCIVGLRWTAIEENVVLNLCLDPHYHLLYICRKTCLPKTAVAALR